MLKLVLLVSGALGYNVLQTLEKKQAIQAVFTNKNSVEIIAFCEEKKIHCFVGNPRKGKATNFIQKINCEVLLSVNYLFIVEQDVINLPSRYAINVHGSLLPRYRGRTPHVWSIINGETETGVTAHLIDSKVDNGDIVQQIRIPIDEDDTGAMILDKFNVQYPILLTQVLQSIETNSLKTYPQNHSKATYFGKRTPADGQINWDWSKERIRNWIRAQAAPYPGAFCFYKKHKITIHKAIYSDYGFHAEMPNGSILDFDKNSITVKVANGCLRLEKLEMKENILRKNDILL